MLHSAPAHSIVEVPDHYCRVPAYHRKHFKDETMLKRPMIKHTPDQFRSAEWIAHNAAMAAKRPLLGQGPRPVIGAMFRSRVQASPGFYAPAKRERLTWRKVWAVTKDCFSLLGAVAVLALMYHLGAVVF